MRAALIRKLTEVMEKEEDIVVLTGDLGFSFLENIENKFPDRFYNVGIAEQALVGIAAGLAKEGKRVVVYSILPFLIYRPYEQILLDVCYHELPVIFVSSGTGFSYGSDAVSHYGLTDLSLMLPIPNIAVYSPAESTEAAFFIEEALKNNKPAYIRLGKTKNPAFQSKIYDDDGITILEDCGENIVFSTGDISLIVEKAVHQLKKEGILFSHIHVGKIKPLSSKVYSYAEKSQLIVSIEEHQPLFGFGTFLSAKFNKKIYRIGVDNIFERNVGERDYMLKNTGLDLDGICNNLKFLVR
jgi:transketolase